jgi:period circadian protein 2
MLFSLSSGDGASGLAMFGSTYPCNTVCASLRMYRGLRTSGFGIVDKKTSYVPYRITLMLEKINVPPVGQTETTESANSQEQTAQPHQHPEDEAAAAANKDPLDKEQDPDSSEFYLLAYAVPITSAYKGPEEKNPNGQFSSSTCMFSEVDLGNVPYLDHLPQDLLGTSALDFYHPNDLPELKNIYNSVIGRQGKSVRSKPYPFRAFNGCLRQTGPASSIRGS